MKFKLLAGAILLVFAAWSAWWWLAAGAQKSAIEGWMEAQRAKGWQAESADISVIGYPSRLDATLREIQIANVDTGWSWEAERLSIRQVIYDPTFSVLHFPPESLIAAPGARARLTAERMEASLRVADAATFALERFSFDGALVGLAADAGWTASAERVGAHLIEAPEAGPDNAYQFRLDAVRIRPPRFIRRIADPAGVLPQVIRGIGATGRVAFDRPLDRSAIEGAPPDLTALSLTEARAEWGDLALELEGFIQADRDGYAEGAFDVEAKNWRRMIEAAVAAGVMPRTLADTLETGLGFVASLGGDPNALSVALTFSGGFTRIGPVPIGPAPRMWGR